MFGLTRRNQDISTYNPWREMEEFEKPFSEDLSAAFLTRLLFLSSAPM